jgi:hypothetical protein
MKKIISILVLVFLVLSGLGETAVHRNNAAIPFNTIATMDNHPPLEPKNPHPPNSSINVSINIVLYWTGGDPDPNDTVTYDVYLGGDYPPNNLVSYNQTETYYDPTELILNTTYVWQIVAWDNHGASTLGLCWNFTTGINHPPSAPIIKQSSSTATLKNFLGMKSLLKPLSKPGPFNFTFNATDPDRDDIYYFIDWGDGSTSGWSGPYRSSEEVIQNHTWIKKGTYLVRAKAKDIYDQEGPWGTMQIPFQQRGMLLLAFLFFQVIKYFMNL